VVPSPRAIAAFLGALMLHLLAELDNPPANEDTNECQLTISSLRRQIRIDVTNVVRGEYQALHVLLEEGLQNMKRSQQEEMQQQVFYQINAIWELLCRRPMTPPASAHCEANCPPKLTTPGASFIPSCSCSASEQASFPPKATTPGASLIPSCNCSLSEKASCREPVLASVITAFGNAVHTTSPAAVTALSPEPSVASIESRSIEDLGGIEKERLNLPTKVDSPPAPYVPPIVPPVDLSSITRSAEEHIPLQPKENHPTSATHTSTAMQDLAAASGWANKHTQDERDRQRLLTLRNNADPGRCTTRFRNWLLDVVLHPTFDAVTGLIIISNALFMGIKTQVLLSEAADGKNRDTSKLELVEYLFTFLFGVEWLMRLIAYQNLFFRTKERFWHLFDTLIIASGVTELVVEISNTEAVLTNGETMILRILRTIRLMRLLRVGRFVHSFRELRLLISGLMGSTRSLAWSILFLLLVMYTFGIFFEQGVVSYVRNKDRTDQTRKELLAWFGSMDSTMVTMFSAISGGTDWLSIMTPLAEISRVYTVVFMIYIFATYHGILHVMMSIFVDSTMTASRNDRDLVIAEELSRKDSYLTQMGEVFRETDIDGNGTVTWEEFEAKLQDPRIQAYFSALDLDVAEAKGLFHLLDSDESNSVPIEEFVVGCFRLKGGAKGIDLAALMHENKKMVKVFHRFMDSCNTFFHGFEVRLQAIDLRLKTPPEDTI